MDLNLPDPNENECVLFHVCVYCVDDHETYGVNIYYVDISRITKLAFSPFIIPFGKMGYISKKKYYNKLLVLLNKFGRFVMSIGIPKDKSVDIKNTFIGLTTCQYTKLNVIHLKNKDDSIKQIYNS